MANGITNVSGGKALSGTAQPSDVRLGMTYADGKELREGTLDLRNLKAENIKKDVNIAGVVGGFGKGFRFVKEERRLADKYLQVQNTEKKELFKVPAGAIAVGFKNHTSPYTAGQAIYLSGGGIVIDDGTSTIYETYEGGYLNALYLLQKPSALFSATDLANINKERTIYVRAQNNWVNVSISNLTLVIWRVEAI